MTFPGRIARVLVLAAVMGCASGPVPQTRYYTLGAPGEEVPAQAPGEGATVGVDPLVVDPPYDQDRLVYRAGETSAEVGFYEYHRWASPLGRLTATALSEGLRGTPGVAAIEPSATGVPYTARLGGRVVFLEEVDRPGGQEVRLAMELELTGAGGRVLWADRLTETSTVDVDSVPEIVIEVERLFGRILERARTGIAAALRAP